MKVKMTKGRAASQSEIAALQQKIGMPLPSEFLEFVATNDGAEPETNIFKVGSDQESGVNGFIPIREIAKEMELVEFWPETAIPVAWAEGGDYVFIHKDENGAVYYPAPLRFEATAKPW